MTRRQLLRFLLVQEALLLVLAFGAARWWEVSLWQDWAISADAWWWIAIGTGGLFAANGLIWWTSESVRLGLRGLFDTVLGPLKPRDFLVIALASGIAEEIAFRGVLQPLIGIVASNLLFALLHVPSRQLWFYGLWALFAGLFLGNLYAWTDNLFVPIGVHVLNNLGSLWAWHLGRQRRSRQGS